MRRGRFTDGPRLDARIRLTRPRWVPSLASSVPMCGAATSSACETLRRVREERMTSAHDANATVESTSLTRRQALMAGAATFVGYAVGVDKALAQAIKTDTTGIVAGDHNVKIGDYSMPVYEARPASGTNAPIILAIS